MNFQRTKGRGKSSKKDVVASAQLRIGQVSYSIYFYLPLN